MTRQGAFSGFPLCVAVGKLLAEPYVDLRAVVDGGPRRGCGGNDTNRADSVVEGNDAAGTRFACSVLVAVPDVWDEGHGFEEVCKVVVGSVDLDSVGE